MLQIPYEKNPNNACALSCATMVARYFFPETRWNDIAKIVGWEPGYVVWTFKFMLWMMDRGIRITDYDLIDYEAWASKGIEGLKASVSKKEFQFYLENTKDLNAYTKDIQNIMRHKNFTYHRQKPALADLENAYKAGSVCEVTLDSGTLDGKKEFILHRVVILDVTPTEVIFHDPRKEPRPARKEARAIFEKAWLHALDASELCVYAKM